jgi:hypothetical protein
MKESNMLPSLYGTEIMEKKCVGYCKKHCGYMTCKQLKRKECLKKQCKALERHPHEFWEHRALIKMKKRNKEMDV